MSKAKAKNPTAEKTSRNPAIINTDSYEYKNGMKCCVWGIRVPKMNRLELVAFIGHLDEVLTMERKAGAMKCADCSRVEQVAALQETVALKEVELVNSLANASRLHDAVVKLVGYIDAISLIASKAIAKHKRHEIHTLILLLIVYSAAWFTVGCYFGIYP
jgi:hypothetical protein